MQQDVISKRCIYFLNNKVAAYSIIELMTTIAILAILASVSLPSYTSFIQRQQIKSTSDEPLYSVASDAPKSH